MSDQFDPSARRRGRRDPALALELNDASITESDTSGELAGDFAGLLPGDQMVYKIVRELPDVVTGRDRWVTFGASTSILEGETNEQAAQRLYSTVSETFARIVDAEDQEAREAAEEERRRPITPRRG